jgi:hypothetical protein
MKVDVTSSMIEKSIDLAKDFLGKLIGPAIEELGLLAKDQVTMFKFKNQVRMLNKAKAYCEKHNISPKTISLKILCPLLENAALEDNEDLQDKWATLLANMVDSEQNIDNHVFPYLLSQISIAEFSALEKLLNLKIERLARINADIFNLELEYPDYVRNFREDETGLFREIEIRKNNNVKNPGNYIPIQDLQASLKSIRFKMQIMEKHKKDLISSLKNPQLVDEKEFEDYELGNLIRLGIIKSIPRSYIHAEPLEVPNEPNSKSVTVDLEIEIHADYDEHILTQLGELFLKACSEKQSPVNLQVL